MKVASTSAPCLFSSSHRRATVRNITASSVVSRWPIMYHNDPYNIFFIASRGGAQRSTAWQDVTAAACLKLLATVQSMSFDRLITWPTSHKHSVPQSLAHPSPKPPSNHKPGLGSSVTVHPRARHSSENAIVEERRHNINCSCKLLSIHRLKHSINIPQPPSTGPHFFF